MIKYISWLYSYFIDFQALLSIVANSQKWWNIVEDAIYTIFYNFIPFFTTIIMYSWNIKVGDLLTKPGSEDIITRTSQPIDTIPNITDDKLDLRFKIASVNHGEVRITILWLKADFDEVCDYSGVEFVRALRITEEDNEILRFSLDSDDDEVYPIVSRDNAIDFLEPLTQLIRLYEPVSKVAPWYVFPEEDGDDNLAVNRIIFK
jgi:hypothetical protein